MSLRPSPSTATITSFWPSLVTSPMAIASGAYASNSVSVNTGHGKLVRSGTGSLCGIFGSMVSVFGLRNH